MFLLHVILTLLPSLLSPLSSQFSSFFLPHPSSMPLTLGTYITLFYTALYIPLFPYPRINRQSRYKVGPKEEEAAPVSRQQTADNRQQTADSRQQTTDSYGGRLQAA
jgi:hypothetical protein